MTRIANMRAAGLTDSEIVRLLDLEEKERLAERREQNRINQRNHRARKHVSADTLTQTKIPTSRGSRLAVDWRPDQSLLTWSATAGFSGTDIDRELARFRDYWMAAAGDRGVKRDWPATWRNWVRTVIERRVPAPNSNTDTTPEWIKRDTERIRAERAKRQGQKEAGHEQKTNGPAANGGGTASPDHQEEFLPEGPAFHSDDPWFKS
jgi:hypothetical protein